MISGNVPKHLVVGARTGFLVATKAKAMPWQRLAMVLNMDAAAVDLVDLGAAPMPSESKRGMTVKDMIEKTVQVTPSDWDITVSVSYNAIKDDKTGGLERRVRQAGNNFQKHINKRVFEVLNGGDSSTYGACYDGSDFFDNDHIDDGAHHQTAQDNEYASALSLTNFETVYVAAQDTKNDQGEYTQYDYDLLVVNPVSERVAANIVGNPAAYDTANREENPYAGKMSYVTSSYVDSGAWFLIASNEEIKPLILAMKEQPNLQSAWFDPDQPDGGRYYFKFYARYEVHYGDWRLAYQGNT